MTVTKAGGSPPPAPKQPAPASAMAPFPKMQSASPKAASPAVGAEGLPGVVVSFWLRMASGLLWRDQRHSSALASRSQWSSWTRYGDVPGRSRFEQYRAEFGYIASRNRAEAPKAKAGKAARGYPPHQQYTSPVHNGTGGRIGLSVAIRDGPGSGCDAADGVAKPAGGILLGQGGDRAVWARERDSVREVEGRLRGLAKPLGPRR